MRSFSRAAAAAAPEEKKDGKESTSLYARNKSRIVQLEVSRY